MTRPWYGDVAQVYFEKMLKAKSRSPAAEAASIWVRNIQLGLAATPLAALGMWLQDGPKVRHEGRTTATRALPRYRVVTAMRSPRHDVVVMVVVCRRCGPTARCMALMRSCGSS